VIFIGAFGMTS